MDIRQTFSSEHELMEMLADLKAKQRDVALLVDRDGLARAAGKITALATDNLTNSVTVSLNNDNTYEPTEIIAVNGIFRSDYSEC